MKKLLVAGLLVISLSGCSLFNTEPFIDSHEDNDGQLVLSDTKKNWEFFRETVDLRVEAELLGRKPEGGKDTWNDYWLWLIDAQKTGRENGSRYINYIIDARRAKGLPELQNGI